MTQEITRQRQHWKGRPQTPTVPAPHSLPLLTVGSGPRKQAAGCRNPSPCPSPPPAPACCKWGCGRPRGCCLPRSCSREMAQSYVVQGQPQAQAVGPSQADWAGGLGHPSGWTVGGGAPWVSPGGVRFLGKEQRERTRHVPHRPPPPPSAGPSSCCSAGRASGTAGPGSWAGPWGRAGSRRPRAPRWRPGSARLRARGWRGETGPPS